MARLAVYFVVVITTAVLFMGTCSGAEPGPPLRADKWGVPAVSCGEDCAGLLFPADDLYVPYLADPHRPGFGTQRMWYVKSAIPDASGDRLNVKVGGVFGVFRATSIEKPERAWQIGVIGAFDSLFDMGNAMDNIGWNGNYGLQWSAALQPGLAARLGWFHRSSHLGDEYQEKTGRKRIGYTREELGCGISWEPLERVRLYGDAGYGYGLGNRGLMAPWRLQGGIEYRGGPLFSQGKFAWYTALDATAMEERDWRTDLTLQLGLMLVSGGRTWRLGFEQYYGRPTVGEFFSVTEQYLSGGIWMDW